ncbi:esterase [Cricetibacter osteomyelitidis]|uniref:Esterase n=1 Tax=Cricetibacter osteomyelitidis TaxID=1521931 RepID=A0A4R2T7X6_9PAST|nr:alpha/beta fold hydrolase [Cricetibacter osteomyelitidis]TCP97666.1 esterase [Cricetibacter osteomyelitidis]
MNLLHYQFNPLPESQNPVLVFIHGLFGDANNLGVIARAFSDNYPILRVDLRNHGNSFHSETMNYDVMAEDLLILLNQLELHNVILIGHSMGGKTAMKTAALAPNLVEKLIVLDISPVQYQGNHHDDVFQGLFAVQQSDVQTRQQAKPILAQHIKNEAIIQFMLKSFEPQSAEKFRFNVTALFRNYRNLMDWQPVFFDKPTLFIKGGQSDYILPEYGSMMLNQFPQAASFVIANSGHWIHADKPDSVIRAINKFLQK